MSAIVSDPTSSNITAPAAPPRAPDRIVWGTPMPPDYVAAERDLRDVFAEFLNLRGRLGRAEVNDRRIIVTEFAGAYERAGWIVALEGSPPRGIFVVPRGVVEHTNDLSETYFFYGSCARTLTPWRWPRVREAVIGYLRAWRAVERAA